MIIEKCTTETFGGSVENDNYGTSVTRLQRLHIQEGDTVIFSLKCFYQHYDNT